MFPNAYFAKSYFVGQYFPPLDGGPPPAVAGYGVSGPTVIDAYPIVGVVGVPTSVLNLTKRTH